MKSNKKLTDSKIKALSTQDKDYKVSDGGSLYLVVMRTGYKSWQYNYESNGKQKTYYIGGYPIIGLAQAREKRDKARDLLQRGIAPNQHKKQVKALNRSKQENSFKAIGREWFLFKSPSWA